MFAPKFGIASESLNRRGRIQRIMTESRRLAANRRCNGLALDADESLRRFITIG